MDTHSAVLVVCACLLPFSLSSYGLIEKIVHVTVIHFILTAILGVAVVLIVWEQEERSWYGR
jgi:hypothetical protein